MLASCLLPAEPQVPQVLCVMHGAFLGLVRRPWPHAIGAGAGPMSRQLWARDGAVTKDDSLCQPPWPAPSAWHVAQQPSQRHSPMRSRLLACGRLRGASTDSPQSVAAPPLASPRRASAAAWCCPAPMQQDVPEASLPAAAAGRGHLGGRLQPTAGPVPAPAGSSSRVACGATAAAAWAVGRGMRLAARTGGSGAACGQLRSALAIAEFRAALEATCRRGSLAAAAGRRRADERGRWGLPDTTACIPVKQQLSQAHTTNSCSIAHSRAGPQERAVAAAHCASRRVGCGAHPARSGAPALTGLSPPPGAPALRAFAPTAPPAGGCAPEASPELQAPPGGRGRPLALRLAPGSAAPAPAAAGAPAQSLAIAAGRGRGARSGDFSHPQSTWLQLPPPPRPAFPSDGRRQGSRRATAGS